MGFDMLLERINNDILEYKDIDEYKLEEINPPLYKKLKPYMIKDKYGDYLITERMAYWRKEWDIHAWFEKSLGKKLDDWEFHVVSKQVLDELLQICRRAETLLKKIDEKVNDERIEKDEYDYEDVFDVAEFFTDAQDAEERADSISPEKMVIPDYDYWFRTITRTVSNLEKILKETDFDKESILYKAGW